MKQGWLGWQYHTVFCQPKPQGGAFLDIKWYVSLECLNSWLNCNKNMLRLIMQWGNSPENGKGPQRLFIL